MPEENELNSVELAAEITMAWLGNPNNRIEAEELPALLRSMHGAVAELSGNSNSAGDKQVSAEFTPAVSARKSLASKDHIVSMIDGKPYKTLRRHLSTHGLTPEQYRTRYNLKPDYPMVAENYSKQRREMAKKIGLGQKGRAARATPKTAAKPAAAKTRSRQAKSA